MATELIANRRGLSLVAASAADLEALEGLAASVDYRCVLTRAQGRSVRQNRMLWGLAKIVADNLPEQSEPLDNEAVVAMLKQEAGFVTPIKIGNGAYRLIPRSVSFEKCDQDTFNRFFEKALGVVERDIIPGLTSAVVRAEVEAMIAPRARAA